METITINVVTPSLDYTTLAERKEAIKRLAEDVAVKLLAKLEENQRQATIDFWNKKIKQWEIKNHIHITKVDRNYHDSQSNH